MFEVKLKLDDGGFLARLGRAGKLLFSKGKKVEHEINSGNEVGGREGASVYETDAEGSLAMALGKSDVKNIYGNKVDDGMEDALKSL